MLPVHVLCWIVEYCRNLRCVNRISYAERVFNKYFKGTGPQRVLNRTQNKLYDAVPAKDGACDGKVSKFQDIFQIILLDMTSDAH